MAARIIISKDPLGLTRPAIKPGRLPEPVEPGSAHDPPERIAACLDCPLAECRQDSAACPLKSLTRPRRGGRKRAGP